jgi:glucose/arabinose dehydrogenase
VEGQGGRLDDVRVIFQQNPTARSSLHFGSRLVFGRDGNLFVTTGDRYGLMQEAQNGSNHLGKVVRITPDGEAPADNPKVTGWDAKIWSIGHRNVQAAALNPATGELWTIEHGARGGDEVNIPRKGLNYGWPFITYGRDYSGASIGNGTARAGLEQPQYYWDPSIAPSGATFYTGDLMPGWKGNLLVGALARRHLARLVIDGERIIAEERLLENLQERIRDVRQGPDGAIWVTTDSPDGRILRVAPAG